MSIPKHRPCQVSPRARLIIGWTMILVGIPLWILPVPLGLPIIVPGALLVASSSSKARRSLVSIGRALPSVWKHFRLYRRGLTRRPDVPKR